MRAVISRKDSTCQKNARSELYIHLSLRENIEMSRLERSETDFKNSSGEIEPINLETIYNDMDFRKGFLHQTQPPQQLELAPVLPKLEMNFPKSGMLISSDRTERAREKTPEEKEKGALSAGLYGEFGKGNELKAFVPEACVQPNLGDCYLVAALAAKANSNPQELMEMVKENKDGTFQVTFPGLNKSIKVQKPSEDEIKRVPGWEDVVSKYGTWPLVIQKAFGEYYKPGSGLDGCEGGSLFSAGMKALNKEQVKYDGVGMLLPLTGSKEIHNQLMNGLNPAKKKDSLPMTASVNFNPKNGELVANHVYTVMKYEPDAKDLSKGKVTVRNPWGGPDACKEMSLSEFKRDFMQMSFPEKNAPKIPLVAAIKPHVKADVNYEELLKKIIQR